MLLLYCCTVQIVSLGGYIHTYSFVGKSVQNYSRTPFGISFILLNITDGYFSSSDEFRLSQLPGVSELTTAVELPCCDGRTGNPELPLHVVQNQILRLMLRSVILFFFPLDLNMLYANQMLPPLWFAAFLNDRLLSHWIKGALQHPSALW